MSINTLVIQTVSCFEEILKFMSKLSDTDIPERTFLSSLVTNLIQEWKQVSDSEDNSRNRRQMSDHVVSSKKSFENTLERVRRSSKIEQKQIQRDSHPPINLPSETPNKPDDSLYLIIPDSPTQAPTLPPRNNITRGNVIRDKRAPPARREQLLKASNSCCDLGAHKVTPPPRAKNSQTQRESSKSKLSLDPSDTSPPLFQSYESNLQTKANLKSLTPEPFRRPLPESPRGDTRDTNSPRLKTARSCEDLLGISCEEAPGESTLLSNSLRSSYVKFKTRNGKWGKMYITLVGKNIYVSRNYADDQTELVYSLEEFDIVPKDEGRSKYLIQLKVHNTTQCSFSVKSEEIRDDWYKALIRAKYKPKSKSSLNSLEVSPTDVAPERPKRRDMGIYVSANSVDPLAARDLGIKVHIRNQNGTETESATKDNPAENEYLQLALGQELELSGDYVIHSIGENSRGQLNVSCDTQSGQEGAYISPNQIAAFLHNGGGSKECTLNNPFNTCEEKNYYYLQN